jgi:hypothetical protein
LENSSSEWPKLTGAGHYHPVILREETLDPGRHLSFYNNHQNGSSIRPDEDRVRKRDKDVYVFISIVIG